MNERLKRGEIMNEKIKISEIMNHCIKSEMNFQINEMNSNPDFKDQTELIIYDHNIKIKLDIKINDNLEIISISNMNLEIFNEKENIILYRDYLNLFLIIQKIHKGKLHTIESNL